MSEHGGPTTLTTIPDLLTPEGVILPPGEAPVLTVAPPGPRRRFLTTPPHKVVAGRVLFEGAEHTFLGDHATLHFESRSGPGFSEPLHLPNGLSPTYGQVLALGGDFFGVPDAPISDDPAPPQRFTAAFATLAEDTKTAPKDVNVILLGMQKEMDAVNAAIKAGEQPSTAYAKLGDSLSLWWNTMTGGTNVFGIPVVFGRYMKLAATNWDHFGKDALTCYTVGHGVAMAAAVAAAGAADQPTRQAKLEIAYAMNAFADHFLTDAFSAGHMRTPRRELYNASHPAVQGSLMARFMHDEDSAYGLTVTNKRGDTWTAYGDKRLRDTVNTKSLTIVAAAVQASIDEVWAAFQAKAVPASTVLDHAPDLTKVAVATDRTNRSPMFTVQAGTLERRKDITNRRNYDWTTFIGGTFLLAHLKSLPEFRGLDDGDVPARLTTDILQFSTDGSNIGLAVYGVGKDGTFGLRSANPKLQPDFYRGTTWFAVDRDGDGNTEVLQQGVDGAGRLTSLGFAKVGSAYACAWQEDSTTNNGPHPGDALAWRVVDHDGDGRSWILQLADRGGKLRMGLYEPAATIGHGYPVAWQADDMGHPSAALAFLPADLDGDGRTGIVQLRDNGGRMAMVVYEAAATGYAVRWSSDDVGQASANVALIPADVDGDGRTEIIQCRSHNGSLGMTVYQRSGTGYAAAWSGTFAEGSPALGWHAVDVNGDGRNELLQLWDNKGKLGMITYRPDPAHPYGYRVAWQQDDMGGPSAAITWVKLVVSADGDILLVQLRKNNAGNLAMTVYQPGHDGSWAVSGSVDDLQHSADGVFFTAAGSLDPISPS